MQSIVDKLAQSILLDDGGNTATAGQDEPVVSLPSLTLPKQETMPITVTTIYGSLCVGSSNKDDSMVVSFKDGFIVVSLVCFGWVRVAF